jgi:Tfp pilus assembly protein PilO
LTLPVFNASKRTIISFAIAAGVLFCVAGFAYYMCAQKLGIVDADLIAKQKQVDDSTQTAKRLTVVQSEYLDAQNEISFLETSVSSQEYVPTLLKQLESLGKSLDLRVDSVRPMLAVPAPPPPIKKTADGSDAAAGSGQPGAQVEAPKPKPYDELTIDVELEGSYWNARNFISRLTQFPKIMAVKEVQLSPSQIGEYRGSPKLLVRLRLTAFVFPVQKV